MAVLFLRLVKSCRWGVFRIFVLCYNVNEKIYLENVSDFKENFVYISERPLTLAKGG